MRELSESSTDLSINPAAHLAAELLHYYSFELDGYTVDEQLYSWLEDYSADWITIAIVEALYQGRYKAISVEQILILWHRRGQPVCHFNHEFERMVCNRFPRTLVAASPATPEIALLEPTPPRQASVSFQQPTLSYRKMLLQLPSVKAASKLERLTEIPSLKLASLPVLNGAEPAQQTVKRSPAPASDAQAKEVAPPNGAANGSANVPLANVPVEVTNTNGAIADLTQSAIVPIQPIDSADSSGALSTISNSPELLNGNNPEFKRFKEGVAFALSSGLATSSLKPKLKLELSKFLQSNWQQFMSNHAAIDQFAPASEPSELHSKLIAVAQTDQTTEVNGQHEVKDEG